MAARTQTDAPITIRIPENATPGDHVGGIVALNTAIESTQPDGNVEIGVQRAVGARIYLRVSGPTRASLAVSDVKLEHDRGLLPWTGSGSGTVTYTIENIGNLRQTPAIDIQLNGLFGRDVDAAKADGKLDLLPGQKVTLTQKVSGIGHLDHLTATVTVETTEGVKDAADTGAWVIPWLAILVLVLLVAAAIAWWRRRRRAAPQGHRGRPARSQDHGAEPADDSTSDRGDGPGRRGSWGLCWRGRLLLTPALITALTPARRRPPSPSAVRRSRTSPPRVTPSPSRAAGWPATTQVQAVVCGDLAIGGSSTCAPRSSVLGYVNDDGLVEMNLVVSAPPKPCPCVIRLSSYNGPVVAVDIPFVVSGHPVGTPPTPTLPSSLLTVTDVDLQGDTSLLSWFGAAPQKQLVITVRNDGDAVALDPEVTVGVGKSDNLDAQPVVLDELSLDPGATETVTVDVTLPFAAFGDYRIVGQVGSSDAGTYSTTWSSYPWGLVALNVLGALLLAWGIRRRLDARRRRRLAQKAGVAGVALGATPGLERPYVLPDVVYVSEVGGFLVSPKMAGRSGLLKRVDGRLELQDLAALGAATLAGTPMLSLPAADGPAAGGEAVVDLTALEAHLARRAGGSVGPESTTEVLAVGGGRRRAPRGPSRVASTPDEGAVVDLGAVDQWFGRDQ